MDDGSGGATALLGMDGFVVLSMTEHKPRVVAARRDNGRGGGLSELRGQGGRPRSVGGPGPRPPRLGPAAASVLAQAPLAVSRLGLFDQDLQRTEPARRGLAHHPGAGRDLPAGR